MGIGVHNPLTHSSATWSNPAKKSKINENRNSENKKSLDTHRKQKENKNFDEVVKNKSKLDNHKKFNNPWNKTVKKNKGIKLEELSIINFNCQGLASEGRIYELENALKLIKWDIIGLSEVRCNTTTTFFYRSGLY